jgi:hypothetical protein
MMVERMIWQVGTIARILVEVVWLAYAGDLRTIGMAAVARDRAYLCIWKEMTMVLESLESAKGAVEGDKVCLCIWRGMVAVLESSGSAKAVNRVCWGLSTTSHKPAKDTGVPPVPAVKHSLKISRVFVAQYRAQVFLASAAPHVAVVGPMTSGAYGIRSQALGVAKKADTERWTAVTRWLRKSAL